MVKSKLILALQGYKESQEPPTPPLTSIFNFFLSFGLYLYISEYYYAGVCIWRTGREDRAGIPPREMEDPTDPPVLCLSPSHSLALCTGFGAASAWPFRERSPGPFTWGVVDKLSVLCRESIVPNTAWQTVTQSPRPAFCRSPRARALCGHTWRIPPHHGARPPPFPAVKSQCRPRHRFPSF